MKLEKFFDEQARARVAEAVKAAEARTSGQIVPVVVDRSGRLYWPMSLIVLFMGAFYYLALLLVQDHAASFPALAKYTAWHAMVGWGAASAVLLILFRGRPFGQPFGPFHETAARHRALRAFREHGVDKTREKNGVLLFASIYERKVVVLGDSAVHAKLGDEHWKKAVATLVAGIKAGDPASGFCAAIADIGDEMAKAFPPAAASKPNELPDDLKIDR